MPDAPDGSSAVRLVALRETPLEVDEVLAALDDDASGGLTLFVGRVRDHDGGRGVYFEDPNGHLLEVITRPYGSGGWNP